MCLKHGARGHPMNIQVLNKEVKDLCIHGEIDGGGFVVSGFTFDEPTLVWIFGTNRTQDTDTKPIELAPGSTQQQ